MNSAGARIAPLQIVNGAMFLAWVWKLRVFLLFDTIYRYRPLRVSFFPAFLQAPAVLELAYCAALALSLIFGLRSTLTRARVAGIVWLTSAGVLLCHEGAYNDATFVTVAWVALWMTWYAWRRRRTPEDELIAAPFLAQAIIALVFLGGFVGKLTPGFLDGTVFYDIYLRDRDFWFFSLLREYFAAETLPRLATGYAWLVVAVEGIGALSLFFPTRAALVFGIGVMFGMIVFNNFLVLSVLAPLIGLACAGLWLESRRIQESPRGAIHGVLRA